MEVLAGLLLCIGLWTPIAGGVLSIAALWSAFTETGDPWAQILLAAVGAALAMLGLGLVDRFAALGRKRLIYEPRAHRASSSSPSSSSPPPPAPLRVSPSLNHMGGLPALDFWVVA